LGDQAHKDRFNKIGNREMYMNCAVVDVIGSDSYYKKKLKQKRDNYDDTEYEYDYADADADAEVAEDSPMSAQAALSGLPKLYVANLKNVNSCQTRETVDPVFDDPGEDVEYGGDESSAAEAESWNKKRMNKRSTCTGTGRKASGGSAPSSSSTGASSSSWSSTSSQSGGSSGSSSTSGDDGQWHEADDGQWHGDSNQEDTTSDDSSSATQGTVNCNDGQYHPDECGHGPPTHKSETKVAAQQTQQHSSDADPGHSGSSHHRVWSGYDTPAEDAYYADSGDYDESADYWDWAPYRQATTSQAPPGSEAAPSDASEMFWDSFDDEDMVNNIEVVSDGTSSYLVVKEVSTTITAPLPLRTPIYDADGHMLVDAGFGTNGANEFLVPEPDATSSTSSVPTPAVTPSAQLPEIYVVSEESQDGTTRYLVVELSTTTISAALPLQSPIYDSNGFLLVEPDLSSDNPFGFVVAVPNTVPVTTAVDTGIVEPTAPMTIDIPLDTVAANLVAEGGMAGFAWPSATAGASEITGSSEPFFEGVVGTAWFTEIVDEPIIAETGVPEPMDLAGTETEITATVAVDDIPAVPTRQTPTWVFTPVEDIYWAPFTRTYTTSGQVTSVEMLVNPLRTDPASVDAGGLVEGGAEESNAEGTSPVEAYGTDDIYTWDPLPIDGDGEEINEWDTSSQDTEELSDEAWDQVYPDGTDPPDDYWGRKAVRRPGKGHSATTTGPRRGSPSHCEDPEWNCDGCASPSRCVKINRCTRSCARRLSYTRAPVTATVTVAVTRTVYATATDESASTDEGATTEGGYLIPIPPFTTAVETVPEATSSDVSPFTVDSTPAPLELPSSTAEIAPAPSAPLLSPPPFPILNATAASNSTSISTSTETVTTTVESVAPSTDAAACAPDFVGDDTSPYLPCQPGTYLCKSATQFYTCGQFGASGEWEYGELRELGGMTCVPTLVEGSVGARRRVRKRQGDGEEYYDGEDDEGYPEGDGDEEGEGEGDGDVEWVDEVVDAGPGGEQAVDDAQDQGEDQAVEEPQDRPAEDAAAEQGEEGQYQDEEPQDEEPQSEDAEDDQPQDDQPQDDQPQDDQPQDDQPQDDQPQDDQPQDEEPQYNEPQSEDAEDDQPQDDQPQDDQPQDEEPQDNEPSDGQQEEPPQDSEPTEPEEGPSTDEEPAPSPSPSPSPRPSKPKGILLDDSQQDPSYRDGAPDQSALYALFGGEPESYSSTWPEAEGAPYEGAPAPGYRVPASSPAPSKTPTSTPSKSATPKSTPTPTTGKVGVTITDAKTRSGGGNKTAVSSGRRKAKRQDENAVTGAELPYLMEGLGPVIPEDMQTGGTSRACLPVPSGYYRADTFA
jgi:hypothetical protein